MPITLGLILNPTSVQPGDNLLVTISGRADTKGARGLARVYDVAPSTASTLIYEKKQWKLQTLSFNYLAPATEGSHTIRLDFIVGNVTTSASLVLTVSSVAPPPPTAAPKTDDGTYAEPTLPVLPAAGGKFTDPTFGVTIMRVTDGNDGTYLSTAYSYWPTFNCDVTRLVTMNGDGTKLFYAFNPTTFVLGAKSIYSGALDLSNGSYWHATDPDIIYSFKSVDTKLYQRNVSSGVESTVKDFAADIGAGKYIFQPSMSDDCSVIGFTVKSSADYSPYGYMVYNLNTSTVLLYVTDSRINEVHVSKDGTHASVDLDGPQAIRLWNLADIGTNQYLLFYDPTSSVEGMSHNTMEATNAVGFTATYTATISKWALTNLARTVLLDIGWASNITGVAHISCLADDGDWSLIGFSDGNPHITKPFHNELFLIKNDGSGDVYRFCHHRGVFYDYFDSQFANISRDGKWVAFTSNWGATTANSRRDVFVVNIPDSPAAS